jgi:hypothetical protein
MRIVSTAATAALAMACVVADQAHCADPSLHRPGLWEMSVQSADSNQTARAYRLCLDAATEGNLLRLAGAMPKETCSRSGTRIEGAQRISDSVCSIGSTQATTHAVVTFDGDSAFRAEIRVHYEPAFFGKTDSTVTQTGRWTGSCGTGMQPGDVLTSTGMKLNLNHLPGAGG